MQLASWKPSSATRRSTAESVLSLKFGGLIYIAILSSASIIFLVHISHFVHLMLFGDRRNHHCAMPAMLHLVIRLCIGFQRPRALLRKRSGIVVQEWAFIVALNQIDVT